MGIEERIEQFRNMAEADPGNELGHWSLGRALHEAGRPADAIPSLRRAVEINPNLSRAYQLLGECLDSTGQRDKAIEVVTRGVTVADRQGDRMPLAAMVELLRGWKAPVPVHLGEATGATPPSVPASAAEGFQCSRCGRPGGKLAKPPFKGSLGQRVFEQVCEQCWREWIPMGTKVINELGLALSTPEGQETYDQYMMEFLQLDPV